MQIEQLKKEIASLREALAKSEMENSLAKEAEEQTNDESEDQSL